MKNVIFLAPPLAGKGTFSEYLVKNFGYLHYSTGDILRKKANEDKQLKALMESGALVSDDLILSLIEEVLQKVPKNQPFILDGIPRTLHQAKKLDIILNGLNLNQYVVINIDVRKDILIDRVIGRRSCPNCHRVFNINIKGFGPKVEGVCDDCSSVLIQREDDTLESYEKRYQSYVESTSPVITYYKEKGCLKVISNEKSDQTEALQILRGVIS